jgi:regulatory protein
MAKLRLSLKARALKYLSAREHSRLELLRKLTRHAQEGDDIDALLDTLEACKLLSAERFSESLVRRRAARFGASRIVMELQSHGIDPDSVKAIRNTLSENENERARVVWCRKFARVPADAAERAKQVRFLQQRGFSGSAIQAVLRQGDRDADEQDG